VQEPIPELLLGHDIGLKKHYLRLTEDEILEEYLKAVDSLTINEENRLKRKVQKLTQETDQIKIMQEQITRLQERHSDLVKSIAGLANSSLPMLHAKSRELFTHEEDLKKWKEENTGRVSLEDMK
jgi:hypothetical protein